MSSIGANIRYTGIFIENSNAVISPAVDQIRYLANSHIWQTWGNGINSNLPLKTINAISNHNTIMTLSNLNVGIGTTIPNQKLHVQGNIYASGDITALSDERYKTDLQIIQNPLNIIQEIHGYTFKRNDINNSPRYLGVIAQEIQKVLPEAINENTDGSLSVAYGNLNALLIEGIRELIDEIRICKERIYILEQK